MKKFWNKQLPAALLALIMMVSLVPLAGAEDEHQHQYSTQWTSDQSGHWHQCTGCSEKADEAAHTLSGWTSQNETHHVKKCTVCGYATESAPHSFPSSPNTQTPPTCYQNGEATYVCTDCGYTKRETIIATGAHVENTSIWSSNASYHWHPCQTSGCTYQEFSKAAHQYSTNYVYDNTSHWQTCMICGASSAKTSHTPDPTGKCTVCKAQVSQSYSVTFQTPAGSTVIPTQTVLAGQRPSAVSTPSSFTSGGSTYTFYGWMKGSSSNYIYTNQSIVNPANEIITGNTTFTALYKTNGYTLNFYYLTTNTYGPTTTSRTSNVPANSYAGYYTPSTPNITYNGKTYTFKGWTTVPYSGSTGYIYTNQYLIPSISVYPITGNTNFYAVYTTDDSAATVSYSVDPGKRTSFNSRDFYNAYRNQYNGTLSYVTFSISRSTYDNFSGAIYSGNSVLTYSDLNNSRFYYSRSDAGRNDYVLDDLTLEASSNAKDDSVTMNFTAYGTWGTMSGTVKLTVGNAKVSDKTVLYKVTPGKTVDFDRSDFNKVYQTTYPNETLGYVVFDRPDSSAFSYGTLYSNYGKSSQTKFSRTDLNDAYFYYNSGYAVGRNDYILDNLTFAADSGFKTTVTLDFTAYGINSSRKVTGKVEIRSSESTQDSITYKVTPGRTVSVSRTDFLNLLRKTYANETLKYVTFSRPDSNAFSYGTLYSNYNTTSQTMFTQSTLSSAAFYYNASDATGRYDYPLDSLTFVADTRFSTAVKLSFTAYDDDRDYVEGTLIFQPEGTAASSNYVGSVRYNTTGGTNVQINANDIARYFNKSTGGTLQYVTLTGIPSTGTLYYNYYGASKYGSAARLQLTSANAGTQALYFNPSSTSQYALTELTYVPNGSNYCVSIPFVAYGSGYSSVSGAILISVSRSTVSEVYGVTSRNTAVNFPASGIYSAVLNATGSALYSIQLLSLPSSNAGAVYVGTGTSTRANTTTQYTYASGTNSISQLRFVPTATYTGSVEIPYVALNSNGTAIASGVFSLGVVNSRKSFSDVGTSTWCYKYITELSDAGVIDGYANGSFKPDSTISYGAALKLVMLSAGYAEQKPTNSNVFSGYLAKAQADGLVTRSNVNLAAPITRLQVAQLAAGALKLSTSNLSSVKPFTDTSDLYVQALNAAGIVEGYFSNGTSTYKPNNTLTRGQVSAIVWRMLNYRK